MNKLILTSRLKGMGKEFFLQTSGDPENKLGTCILFEGDKPIDLREFRLPDNPKQVAGVIDEYHKNRFEKFNRLDDLYVELIDETDASILEKLALSLIDQKLYEEAIKILERGIEHSPQNSFLLNYLGLTNLELENYQKAEDNFNRAIQININFPDYHNNLGKALLKQGKCLSASKSFEKAIELNVYYAEAYYNLALTLILNGIKKEDYNLALDLEENASKLLAKSVGFDPSFKSEYLEVGLDALGNKDLELAFIELSKGFDEAAAGKFPKKTYSFHLEYLFRNNLLKEETVVKYIKQLTKLLDIHPNYADYYNELGIAYSILTQFHSDRAIEAYQKALKLNPEYKTAIKNFKLIQNELKGLKTLLKAILK